MNRLWVIFLCFGIFVPINSSANKNDGSGSEWIFSTVFPVSRAVGGAVADLIVAVLDFKVIPGGVDASPMPAVTQSVIVFEEKASNVDPGRAVNSIPHPSKNASLSTNNSAIAATPSDIEQTTNETVFSQPEWQDKIKLWYNDAGRAVNSILYPAKNASLNANNSAIAAIPSDIEQTTNETVFSQPEWQDKIKLWYNDAGRAVNSILYPAKNASLNANDSAIAVTPSDIEQTTNETVAWEPQWVEDITLWYKYRSGTFLLYFEYIAGGILVGAVCGAIVLPLVGFTCCGVLACSCAACCQAGIGNVAAGSAFAILQSLGATGIGAAFLAVVGSVLGGVAGFYIAKSKETS